MAREYQRLSTGSTGEGGRAAAKTTVLELSERYSITHQQAAWAIELVTRARHDANHAARLAGYADPSVSGSRLLRNERVMEAARWAAEQELAGHEVTGRRVVEELASIAFANITDVLDIEGDELVLKAGKLSDLPEAVRRAIRTVRLTTRTRETLHGNTKSQTEVTIQLHEKTEALKLLALATGLGQRALQHEDDGWSGLVIEAPGAERVEDDEPVTPGPDRAGAED